MRVTATRWASACAIAGMLGVALLRPRAVEEDAFSSSWSFSRPWSAQRQRENALVRHVAQLVWQFGEASDVEQLRRAFSGSVPPAGAPLVVFDSRVPALARGKVAEAIDRERLGRPALRDQASTGILVTWDSAYSFESFPGHYVTSGSPFSTTIVPPSELTRGRCIAIVHLLGPARLWTHDAPERLQPLDACAFYDAFGAPGRRISGWLADEHYAFARGFSLRPRYPFDSARSWFGGYSRYREMTCRAGVDTSCVALLHPSRDTLQRPSPNRWRPAQELMPSAVSPSGAEELLQSMVIELGPTRFRMMWQSSLSLEDAYLYVSGEPLARFVRRRLHGGDERYVPGALPSRRHLSLMLAVALAVALAAVVLSERPRVAP